MTREKIAELLAFARIFNQENAITGCLLFLIRNSSRSSRVLKKSYKTCMSESKKTPATLTLYF